MNRISMMFYLSIITCIFIISTSHAAAIGYLKVSATVTCNCNVSGVVVPIIGKACVPACNELKSSKSPSGVLVSQNGDTKTVIY
jgi:hypothetical protein